MYDSCPERSVGYGIPDQGSVRVTSWHRVHTCKFQVLANHTQRVNVRFRDNAQRLFPRTELSEQYLFPSASHFQLVCRLRHIRMSVVLECFKQRVHNCFHGNAQQLFRSTAALERYAFQLCFHSQPVLRLQACQKRTSTVYICDHCICSSSFLGCGIPAHRRALRFNIVLFNSECRQT